jgi:hypothetical protein
MQIVEPPLFASADRTTGEPRVLDDPMARSPDDPIPMTLVILRNLHQKVNL